jgi:CRISPR-associated exonuclease Cas4
MYLIVAAVLLCLAMVLWLAGRGQQRAGGLPAGRVIYVDTGACGRLEQPLFSATARLAGKPDYLVQRGAAVIPVEVKTTRTPEQPHDGHVLQLAAYCLLVEETYGVRPPYGIIRYPERTFAVDYTPALEATLRATLDALRADARAPDVARSHAEAVRCAGCGVRAACDQRLA